MRLLEIVRGFRFVALFGFALALAACANNPNQNAAGYGGAGGPPGSPQEFVVAVGDRVFFESDQTDLTPQARATLDRQAQWLQQWNRYTFTIEGHADERGTREYNIALGARRAEAVRTYLVQQGVPASRIDTISFGKERPIAQGSNEEAWARNRNAHTAIVSGAR